MFSNPNLRKCNGDIYLFVASCLRLNVSLTPVTFKQDSWVKSNKFKSMRVWGPDTVSFMDGNVGSASNHADIKAVNYIYSKMVHDFRDGTLSCYI